MFQKQPSIELHNGIEIPLYGLDTIALNASEAYTFVRQAIDNGIRHIETAAEYGIEAEIGKAIADSGIGRSELFLTDEISGIRNTGATRRSAEAALRRLSTDYVDLLLMGWNGGQSEEDPANSGVYLAWKGLESLYKSGKAHAIGIVDFAPWQIEYLLQDVEIAPMVSHVGLYPGHPDIAKLNSNEEHAILTMAYLPKCIEAVISSRELGILAKKHECQPYDIILQYLRCKQCAITLRQTNISHHEVPLDEEEIHFLDSMKDYGEAL